MEIWTYTKKRNIINEKYLYNNIIFLLFYTPLKDN